MAQDWSVHALVYFYSAGRDLPWAVLHRCLDLESFDMNKFIVSVLAAAALSGCSSDADVASYNLSKSADQFEITRRVVFYNGITGDYMLTIEGLCSLGNRDKSREVSITCKTGPKLYKKHFLGLSDNVTYFVEQLEPKTASVYHYRVIFKPAAIVPDIELKL
jgi:hypothetical protein